MVNYFGQRNSLFSSLLLSGTRQANVAKAFDLTLQRLELDPTRSSIASQHYQTVKALLEERIPGTKMTRIGSFQRHTKIRPANTSKVLGNYDAWQGIITPIDIDALLTVGDATYIASYGSGRSPESWLQDVYKALLSQSKYKVHQLTIDSPVVILDYGSEFKMEIVPGYRDLRTEEKRASGSPPHLVPDGSGNWKIADYATDALVISAINSLSNGKLVPAIKLMKGFVRSRGLQFKSFAVELFCSINFYDINEQVEKSGVPWSYAKIFAYLLNALPKMLTVPLGFHLSDSEKQTLMPSYDYFVEASCSSAAAVAANALTLGDTYDGVNAWRQLYGHPFPPPEAL